MPAGPPVGGTPRRVLRDARLVLLASRDDAAEVLAWVEDQLGPQTVPDWADVPVAATLRFLGSAVDLERRFGCTVLAQAGEYFAVLAPVRQFVAGPGDAAGRLIDHPALLEASAGRLGKPGSAPADAAVSTDICMPPRDAAGIAGQPGPAGTGTLLGVVDTVFDLAHPAFLDPQGLSRVRWLWDVNAAGAGSPVPVGRYYSSDELRQPGFKIEQWETQTDATADPDLAQVWRTHGTTVSSIAAGSAADGSFIGVAPRADIAFIGAGNETTGRIGDAADLLAGLHRLMSEPGPVVANLSTADPLGPHDGSLLGERLLDELLLRPGRSVVVSAGNFGFARAAEPGKGYRHDHAVVPAYDGMADFVLRFDQSLDLADVAEIWIEATDLPAIEIDGCVDDGGQVSLSVHAEETPVIVTVPPFPSHACGNVLAVLTRAGQRWCLSVFFHPAARTANRPPFFPASTWRFAVRGARGRVHAWLDRNNIERGGWHAPLPRAEWLAATVGAPATARRVIAVGAAGAAGQALSSGTGLGPTLDGRLKPDLSARGEKVTAAVAQASPGPWGDSGMGTSIAAPLVAGSVALLFESWGAHAQHATWFDIRQALLRGAVLPDGAQGWDPGLGAGVLSASRALSPAAPDVDLWIARVPDDDGAEPLVREFLCDSPAITVSPPGPDGVVSVSVAVQNRGQRPTADVRVRLFRAALGATAPLGAPPWSTNGIDTPMQTIALLNAESSATVQFTLRPGGAPEQLLAVADNRDDPLPGDAGPASCNNLALHTLGTHSLTVWTSITMHGSGKGDGLSLRLVQGRGQLCLRGMPAGAIPWREAGLYEQAGRQPRPLLGEPGADPLHGRDTVLDHPDDIRIRTDIEGAAQLSLSGDVIAITAEAGELWLPRLRLAAQAPLCFEITVADATPDAMLGLAIYADGRRVGSALMG